MAQNTRIGNYMLKTQNSKLETRNVFNRFRSCIKIVNRQPVLSNAEGSKIINVSNGGFTLLELMIVVIIIGILYAISHIAISGRITYAKETALKHDLTTMRKAIDDFYADKNKYPATLQDLVDNKYIRNIPEDPFTKSPDTWVIIPSSNKSNDVFDIKSSCTTVGTNGKPYNEW